MKKFNYIKWLTEHKHGLEEKVKPGSEKPLKLPDGRAVTKYTAVSPTGVETPMISYDDNLEGPGDNKDPKPPVDKPDEKPDEKKDDENTDDPKKFPFIGPKDKEFEVKMFDISPEATKLYTELQNETFKDNPEMLDILRSSAIQHERLFVIEKIALDDKSASEAQVKCAEEILQIIYKRAKELGKENEHNYLQARIDSIKKIHQEKPREDKEGDCPDSKDLENNKDIKKFRVDKTSTTYGPSNPAPVYREGMSDEEWADAKEAERLRNHPERVKIMKIKKMMDKEKSLKEKATQLGYLKEDDTLQKIEDAVTAITGGGRHHASVSDRGDKIRVNFPYARGEFEDEEWNKILKYLEGMGFFIFEESNSYEANYDREEPPEWVPTIMMKKVDTSAAGLEPADDIDPLASDDRDNFPNPEDLK